MHTIQDKVGIANLIIFAFTGRQVIGMVKKIGK